MLMKTHLAIGVFLMLLLLPHINYIWIFIPSILIASVLPDIDTGFSTIGKKKVFRVVQWLTKHRGIIHSLTFCIIASIVLILIYPPLGFPFFLGYSLHLLADSFTIDGIRPFWPLKGTLNGKIRTGGRIEDAIFVVLCLIDVAVLISIFV